ncbi:MAG: hypothetical protein HXY28_07270 [Hydrogenophilaceae bacterium]|jgi:hypothetical protein|nr:hypothetical protein [Hydrogenophilaceae bacterium]
MANPFVIAVMNAMRGKLPLPGDKKDKEKRADQGRDEAPPKADAKSAEPQ